MSSDPELQQLEEKLAALYAERAKLIFEINNLRKASASGTSPKKLSPLLGRPSLSQPPIDPADKIQLFLKLFRCRKDVFPKRWENTKTGKQGYSPACANEWVKPICQKPKIKYAECSHQKGRTNLCTALHNTEWDGLMPDSTVRYSKNGRRIFHYMGCSTFAEYSVIPEIALAKINPAAPLDKVCLLGCGITTGIGAVLNFDAPVDTRDIIPILRE